MNIKFKAEQTSELEIDVLFDRILAELRQLEYRIKSKTTQVIKFDDGADFSDDFKLVSRFELGKRMHKGCFELIDSNEVRTIKLIYYKSINFEVFFLSIITMFAIIENWFISLMGLAIIIQFLFFATMTKDMNKKMLDRITT